MGGKRCVCVHCAEHPSRMLASSLFAPLSLSSSFLFFSPSLTCLTTNRPAAARAKVTVTLHPDLASLVECRVLEPGKRFLISEVSVLSDTASAKKARVGLLVRLAGQQDVDGVSLHLGATVWLPIGGAATHQGDTGVRVMPRAILAGAFGEVGRWTIDAAFLYRPYASFGPPALGMTAAPACAA